MMQTTNDGGVCDTGFQKNKKDQYLVMVFVTNYNCMDNTSNGYECLYMKIMVQKSL
jgi:hypothetical protein